MKKNNAFIFSFCAAAALSLFFPFYGFSDEDSKFKNDISGYVKSLNFFTETTGFNPEQVDVPLAASERGENLFLTLERARLKDKAQYEPEPGRTIMVKVDYDHQVYLGSFVPSGDFRLARKQTEDRQFLDLSHTFVEHEDGFYEGRFYRASAFYGTPQFDLEIGRQQIPWGLGHFFTPTDLFNPFNPTQIELDERDGVDAVNLMSKTHRGFKGQLIYAPPGRTLHPQRFLAHVWRDVKGYQLGVLGGRVKRDHVAGFDAEGNLKGSTVRGEFLFREARREKDFFKFTVNADHNFAHNIYVLLEYHYNGQGRRDDSDYQLDRLIRGEIQQLGKNYTALLIGHDLTPLLRLENHAIFNMDDASFYFRPELRYELRANLLLTTAAQIFAGDKRDEFGLGKNLYLAEIKFSF